MHASSLRLTVDEYDEATALMPALESSKDLPREEAFLALDEDGETLPSDWYLSVCPSSSSRALSLLLARADDLALDRSAAAFAGLRRRRSAPAWSFQSSCPRKS